MRIGIDIGGTKTELVALDDAGRECLRRREPTLHGDYPEAVRRLAALVLSAEDELGETASVGIGLPGVSTRADGVLRNAYATPYNRQPLKRDLEQLLAREVRFGNDANCFALSEATDGAAQDGAIVFGAILGTGAGGGIVVRGRILGGAHGFAGEWGHNPLPWMTPDEYPGPRCACGRTGCIEQFVSGPALAADHARHTGESLDAVTIADRASAGDRAAIDTLNRHAGRLARALAHVINLIDPEVIVLGGGLSNVPGLYADVPHLWGAFTYLDNPATRLVRARHGDASGVRGAARLWDA